MISASALLTQLGATLRARRAALGLTHAALAERSGLSVRFLSDLEAGRGNISVARLAAVATALDVSLANLFSNGDAGNEITRELATEISTLDEARAREALDWLRARRSATRRSEKIALIGLRGAGKTALGKAVARRMRIAFVELDQAIEEAAGMPLSDIFGIHGEQYYRRLERDQLRAVVARKGRAILATGGGIVTDPESYELLRGACFTIWLEASPADHWGRVVAQGDHRPMKGKPQAMAELRAILAARRDLYSRAHARIDTSALGLKGAIDAITQVASSRD